MISKIKTPVDPYVRRVDMDFDIPRVATYMRLADVYELKADGIAPRQFEFTLESCVRFSVEGYTVHKENKPIAMFGVGDSPESVGNVVYRPVWFLSTPTPFMYPKTFIKHSRIWLDYFNSKYGPIGNSVLNNDSFRWLASADFQPVGKRVSITGKVFIYMVRK